MSVKLDSQTIPSMVDSGANPNCISLRCVQGSSHLRRLEKHPYSGRRICDAKGELIEPNFVIKCQITLGTPKLTFWTEFVVMESLPFSCIIGQKTLKVFESWEVSNTNRILTINKRHIVPFYDDDSLLGPQNIDLITTHKTIIPPYTSAIIDVRATGTGLDAFRPKSTVSVITEGVPRICERLSVEVLPSVNMLTHQNCQQKLKVHNVSPKPKILAKGVKIANCSTDFEFCDNECSVNLVANSDPIDILCGQITDLGPKEMKEARTFLENYREIFTVSSKNIGHTNVQTFDVDDSDIRPVTVPLRRVPLHHRDIVQRLIDRYEELHLLEPIESPFRASTVLVAKKNPSNSSDVTDQYRLCTDYRVLNNHLVSSGWPSPSIDECLDAIGDANLFSSLDFNNGYFQIPCTERAKEALAFSPGYGFKQYTWSVMPQGIKTASSCFQQAMTKTFNSHEECILPPFYDDVTIKSKGFREHLRNAKIILDDVRTANFTLNALKCSFFQQRIKYLGHIISEHSIEIDPDRIKAIINLPPPTDVRSVRRFIGMVQFCSKFMNHLNVILAPLYDLLKNKSKFIWSPHCQKSFEKLKSIMSTPPVLHSPTKSDKFILETDASVVGLGGCLKAVNDEGTHVVGYCSKKFVDNEISWNIVKKEAFAIIHNVKHFHHYLIGNPFTIRCDNRIVCYIKEKNKPKNKKLLNWALELGDYDYVVEHIPSKNNEIADCLSRLMCVTTDMSNLSDEEFVNQQDLDPECVAAKLYLLSGKRGFDVKKLGTLKRHRKDLNIENGVLKWKHRYVVPTGLRLKVMNLCHSHPMSGHFATERTYQRFSDRYFWPGAPNDVETYVNSCEKCNQFNPPRTSYTRAPLQPIETDTRFQLVCYDLAGPFLPTTVRGNCYVLIIVDHFTHWPEFVALPDTKAPTIATALFEHWCCRYGTPIRFHSDGAKNVHGEVMKELCKHFGIDKSKSSRLHPQGDGMAESFVKQLKSCIQKQVDKNGSNWDLFLQTTAFAIRSNIAYNLKCTPAELVLGEKLSQPIDHVFDDDGPKNFNQKQATCFAKDLKSRIESSTEIVNNRLMLSRDKMKKQFDKSSKPPPFSVGDRVMLWKPYKKKGLSGCFQPKWDGPWSIVKFTGDRKTNCKIVNDRNASQKLNVHINQLKLLKDGDTELVTEERYKTSDQVVEKTNGSGNLTDIFLDYLEDFEEVDNRIIPNNIHQQIHQPVEPVPEHRQQIDQRWVSVDAGNIIPGERTRGNRRDYSIYR